jgi:hypothetical protein
VRNKLRISLKCTFENVASYTINKHRYLSRYKCYLLIDFTSDTTGCMHEQFDFEGREKCPVSK